MAMAEPRDWQQHDHGPAPAQDPLRAAEERARTAEEQRVQAEGRCFTAERRRLDAERRLAEVQALLGEARAAGERTRRLVVELIELAAQLRACIDRTPAVSAATAPCPSQADAAERAQMADALAAAVERLRARVAEVKAGEFEQAAQPHDVAAVAPAAAPAPMPREPHKHSMSAIGRWRNRRKQRRAA